MDDLAFFPFFDEEAAVDSASAGTATSVAVSVLDFRFGIFAIYKSDNSQGFRIVKFSELRSTDNIPHCSTI